LRTRGASPKRSLGFAEVTHQSAGAGRPDRTIAPPSKPLVLTPGSTCSHVAACGFLLLEGELIAISAAGARGLKRAVP
jgi:hypothetical protein